MILKIKEIINLKVVKTGSYIFYLRFMIDLEFDQRLNGIVGVDVTRVCDTIGNEPRVHVVLESASRAGVQERLDESRANRVLNHRRERVGLLGELLVN